MRLLNLFKIEFDRNRIFGLDILRAFAILFVVIGHGTDLLPAKYGFKYINKMIEFDGVSIFFVLSGFLIGGILIKIINNKPASFKTLLNFWERRWFRTLPNYYLILILLLFILPLIFLGTGEIITGKWNFFIFTQNFNSPHPLFFEEAWSLCVEEWFYLLIPSFVFILTGLLKINPRNSILIVVATVILLVTAFRFYKFSTLHITTMADWDIYFRKQVLTRLDSLMYGLTGAYLFFFHKDKWLQYKVPLLFAGIFILLVQRYSPVFFGKLTPGLLQCVFSFSITSFGTLLLLPFLSDYKTGKGFIYTFITYISLISYSMYLLHYTPIQKYALSFFGAESKSLLMVFTKYACYWIFTIAGSILLFKFFEKPMMNLRDRLR